MVFHRVDLDGFHQSKVRDFVKTVPESPVRSWGYNLFQAGQPPSLLPVVAQTDIIVGTTSVGV